MGLTTDIVAVIRAMYNNRPTAEYPFAALSQINPLDPNQRPLILETAKQVSQYLIKDQRYYLT